MYDELKRRIIATLSDEDELGGPMQRVYPRAVIASLADSIVADAQELFQAEMQKGQA